jgi:hypothetical protein
MLSNALQVTQKSNETENNFGLLENAQAKSSTSKEITLRVKISHLRDIEYVLE